MTRQRYGKQFKIAAAKVILAGEMSVMQLVKEYEINEQPLEYGQISIKSAA